MNRITTIDYECIDDNYQYTLGLPTQNEKSQTSKLIALTDRCSYNLNIFYISEVFFNVISSKSPVFQGQIGRKSKKYQVPTT